MKQATLDRLLVACRGAVAKRLIRHYRQQGVETCVVFSEADADQPYLDEADYAVFLNGRDEASTYLDPERVVAAAMDAGCDAIHPGTSALAEEVGFHALAHHSNVAVIGSDPATLARAVDLATLASVARDLSLPVVPASAELGPDDDGLLEGARIGTPLWVKSLGGGPPRLVRDLSDLPGALEAVHDQGEARVRLERAVDVYREVGVVVVGDRHGRCVGMGPVDATLRLDGRSWIGEAGPELFPELQGPLVEASVALARALGWVGVGEVRWSITPRHTWFLRGFSARLPECFDLVEQVWGVDLVEAQFDVLSGGGARWKATELAPRGHGLQIGIHHVDPLGRQRPEGLLELLDIPPGVVHEIGVEPGCLCSQESEPLLARLTLLAPTRGAAVVKAKAVVEAAQVSGVPTNLDALRELLGHEDFWRGVHDAHTVQRLLGTRA